MPKQEVIAANLKISAAKAKFVETVDKLKAATEKKLAAAEEKGKKAAAKVIESVVKVDNILAEIEAAADSESDHKDKPEKRLAKIVKLVEKARKTCDKHLV